MFRDIRELLLRRVFQSNFHQQHFCFVPSGQGYRFVLFLQGDKLRTRKSGSISSSSSSIDAPFSNANKTTPTVLPLGSNGF